jgi:hypothetical protein
MLRLRIVTYMVFQRSRDVGQSRAGRWFRRFRRARTFRKDALGREPCEAVVVFLFYSLDLI